MRGISCLTLRTLEALPSILDKLAGKKLCRELESLRISVTKGRIRFITKKIVSRGAAQVALTPPSYS